MNFVLDVPAAGRVSSRVAAPEAESVRWRWPSFPLGAIAVVSAVALWLALGLGVLVTLGELGPLLTAIRPR